MSKFKINKLNILSSWGYNLHKNTECTICRNSLNEKSLYNQNNSETCISEGMCCHAFHIECIKLWTNTNNRCPLCFTKWIYKIN